METAIKSSIKFINVSTKSGATKPNMDELVQQKVTSLLGMFGNIDCDMDDAYRAIEILNKSTCFVWEA